jgi:hypothetical protein
MWIKSTDLRQANKPTSGRLACCDACLEEWRAGKRAGVDVRTSPSPGTGVWGEWMAVGDLHLCAGHAPEPTAIDDLNPYE